MRLGLALSISALVACAASPEPSGQPDAEPSGAADAQPTGVVDGAPLPGKTVVATANIRCLIDDWDVRLPLLAAEIERVRPDVLALQEVCRDPVSGRDALVELRAALSLDYVAVRADTHVAWDHYDEGIAVLSRHPILASTVVDLPPGAFPRRAVVVRIDAPTGPMTFAGTHLSFGDDHAATRGAQLATVRGVVAGMRATCDTAVIVGDFNEQPGGEAVAAAVAGGYDDAWALAHPGEPGPTVPSHDPSARIDYVLISAGNAAPGAVERFLDSPQEAIYPSDHLGVWSELNSSTCPDDF